MEFEVGKKYIDKREDHYMKGTIIKVVHKFENYYKFKVLKNENMYDMSKKEMLKRFKPLESKVKRL